LADLQVMVTDPFCWYSQDTEWSVEKMSKLIGTVGLYLKGRHLVPEDISAALRVAPSWSQVAASSKSHLAVWAKHQDFQGNAAASTLEALLIEVMSNVDSMSALPGLEIGYFDIFWASDVSPSSALDFTCTLSPQSLTLIAKSGLPLQVTVAGVPEQESLNTPPSAPLLPRGLQNP
jgi:hypothetical protein